jgi:hypothetical protein
MKDILLILGSIIFLIANSIYVIESYRKTAKPRIGAILFFFLVSVLNTWSYYKLGYEPSKLIPYVLAVLTNFAGVIVVIAKKAYFSWKDCIILGIGFLVYLLLKDNQTITMEWIFILSQVLISLPYYFIVKGMIKGESSEPMWTYLLCIGSSLCWFLSCIIEYEGVLSLIHHLRVLVIMVIVALTVLKKAKSS